MSGGEDTSGEKTFDPTPHRIEEARKKGDIAKSTDISAAAGYMGLLLASIGFAAYAIQDAGDVLMAFLSMPDRLTGKILAPGGSYLLGGILISAVAAIVPFIVLPFAFSLLSLLAQRVFVVVGDKLLPKLNRISPIAGAKNKFGVSGLVEFAKTLVKMVSVAIALALYLRREASTIAGLATAEPAAVISYIGHTFVSLLAVVAAIATVIGVLDVLWQHFNHSRKLRMSFQEIKDEAKQSEGDPHTKAQRQNRGREIATNRMLLEVPKADVVLVNPVHVAVALKWSRKKGSAPVCVAKGKDEVATRIREAAAAAGVPIHRDPPTARAINATVKLGREIKPEHYRAVAAALRFADAMRRKAKTVRA